MKHNVIKLDCQIKTHLTQLKHHLTQKKCAKVIKISLQLQKPTYFIVFQHEIRCFKNKIKNNK